MDSATKTLLALYLRQTDRGASTIATDVEADAEPGFTLIELLVVIIIIGLLAAIGLPTLLGQVNRAQAVGAQIHLGSFNRAQQAYLLANSSFASSLQALSVEVPSTTQYHTYEVQPPHPTWTMVSATPKSDAVKGYMGVVYVSGNDVETVICVGQQGSLPSVTVTQAGSNLTLSGCDDRL
jgi:type IV pilus assembly protein PilA